MNRYRLLLALMILIPACTPTPVPNAPAPAASGPGFALVINGWKEGESLPESFAANADGMNDAFTKAGFPTVYWGPAQDKNPDRDGLADMFEINRLLRQKSTEMKPGQTLLIYITGHGSLVDNKNRSAQVGTSVNETILEDQLSHFNQDVNIIIIIDSGYSGKFVERLRRFADLIITSTNDQDTAYGDRDPRGEIDIHDQGEEFTSGFVHTWNMILDDPAEKADVEKEASGTPLSYWEVLVGRSAEGSAEKDSNFQAGLTQPQWQRGGSRFKVPFFTRTPTQTRTVTPTATTTATATLTPTQTRAPTLTPTITPTPTLTPIPNHPPVITKFTARFVSNDRTTYYQVTASDPDGDPLTYEWSNSNPCGTFRWQAKDPAASWFHPHPPCPHESTHRGTLTIIVRDGRGGQATYRYTGGSASANIIVR